MSSGRQRRRLVLLVVVAVAGALAGVVLQATGALAAVEDLSIDARFKVRSDHTPPSDVVVVGMEENTSAQLHRDPPFPRRWHARVIDELRKAGARVIAYDLEFVTQTDAVDDNALFLAAQRAGNLVFGTDQLTTTGETAVLGGPAALRQVHAQVGHASFDPGTGDVIRRLRRSQEGLLTFAVVAAGRAGRRIPSDEFRGDGVLLDYRAEPRVIPFVDVYKGRFDRASVRGRIVVVGDTNRTGATVVNDVRATPLGSRTGPEIQATAIDTVLRGGPLSDLTGGLAYPLLLALGLVIPAGALRLHGLRWVPVAGLAVVAWPVASQLAFNDGHVVPFVPGAVAILIGAGGTLVVTYATELRQRRRMRSQFAQFVPAPVVDAVVELADDDCHLPGVRLDATVLFCDLRGFTTTAERIGAERVIEMLNRYLTEMSDAILDQGGTVVSYMGDGVMAVFGAPLPQDDHADRALRAARSMLGEHMDAFNRWVRDADLGDGFRLGVGLCSGPVMSGTVGSARSLDYATVGDTTNTAARLEAMTKETGHALHIADTTRMGLVEPADDLVEIGELDVRGKQGRIRVWTLPPDANGPADTEVDGPAELEA